MRRDRCDVYGNQLTEERLAFTSEVAQLALDHGSFDWADVGSYRPTETKTTAIIRRRPRGKSIPKAEWKRNIFRSDTGIERGIRRMLDPEYPADDDLRVRVMLASVHSDAGFLNGADAEAIIRFACLPSLEGDE